MSRPLLILLSVLACASIGCAHTLDRRVFPPEQMGSLDPESRFLKVHFLDGRVCVLSDWQVDGDAGHVAGEGECFDSNRRLLSSGSMAIPMDSVALFETNVARPHPSVAAMGLLTVASLAVTAACLANPKACFGSCPTFYVSDGEREVLQAEGFSGSVAPPLEATDIDALVHARPRTRDVRLVMRNEALETQVIRRADLLVLPRPRGAHVGATAAGDFFVARDPVPPLTALAPEGDCLAQLRGLDGIERMSAADSTDLAASETIELHFAARSTGRFGLLIGARQSLLSTYLFYQALAWMGCSAGAWFAGLQRGDRVTLMQARVAAGLLGRIEVEVRDAQGEWVSAGTYGELGPIATDVQVIPLPDSGPGGSDVRLRMTKGAWRIDRVSMVALGDPVTPLRVAPARILRGSEEAPGALRALLGQASPLVTFPGDVYTLIYRLPRDPEDCDLFLESRGYYLEWMRREWLAEEDPARLAMLFADPRGSLRRMAPDFKRQEATMEAAFWGSRYAHP